MTEKTEAEFILPTTAMFAQAFGPLARCLESIGGDQIATRINGDGIVAVLAKDGAARVLDWCLRAIDASKDSGDHDKALEMFGAVVAHYRDGTPLATLVEPDEEDEGDDDE